MLTTFLIIFAVLAILGLGGVSPPLPDYRRDCLQPMVLRRVELS